MITFVPRYIRRFYANAFARGRVSHPPPDALRDMEET